MSRCDPRSCRKSTQTCVPYPPSCGSGSQSWLLTVDLRLEWGDWLHFSTAMPTWWPAAAFAGKNQLTVASETVSLFRDFSALII